MQKQFRKIKIIFVYIFNNNQIIYKKFVKINNFLINFIKKLYHFSKSLTSNLNS